MNASYIDLPIPPPLLVVDSNLQSKVLLRRFKLFEAPAAELARVVHDGLFRSK